MRSNSYQEDLSRNNGTCELSAIRDTISARRSIGFVFFVSFFNLYKDTNGRNKFRAVVFGNEAFYRILVRKNSWKLLNFQVSKIPVCLNIYKCGRKEIVKIFLRMFGDMRWRSRLYEGVNFIFWMSSFLHFIVFFLNLDFHSFNSFKFKLGVYSKRGNWERSRFKSKIFL